MTGRATERLPRPGRRRLATRRGGADPGRPRARERRGGGPRHLRRGARTASSWTGGRSRRSRSPTSSCTSRPGVVTTARDPHGRPTVVELVDRPAARRARGPARRRHDGRAAPHQRRPARAPARCTRATRWTRSTRPRSRESPTTRRCAGSPRASSSTTAARRPPRVRRLGPSRLELTLHEGRKHQVKRMCEAVGHPVRRLHRSALRRPDAGRRRARRAGASSSAGEVAAAAGRAGPAGSGSRPSRGGARPREDELLHVGEPEEAVERRVGGGRPRAARPSPRGRREAMISEPAASVRWNPVSESPSIAAEQAK